MSKKVFLFLTVAVLSVFSGMTASEAQVTGGDTLEAQNKQLVVSFWKNFSEGNAGGLAALMADDATFTVMGREEGFEGAGVNSKQGFIDILTWIEETIPAGLLVSINNMIAEGNKVAAEGESYGITTKGKAYRGLYHFLFEFENGKIKAVREYLDTMHAQQILIDDYKTKEDTL